MAKKINRNQMLAEECIIPGVLYTDSYRAIMLTSNVNQIVNLVQPELPKFYTGFENQIGERSLACFKAKGDFEIVDIFQKNEYTYSYLIKYTKPKLEMYNGQLIEKPVFDIINFTSARNLTEDYGYALFDRLKEKNIKIGDKVLENEVCFSSNDYDAFENFSYGVNLKTAYFSYFNLTNEDAVVLSKKAADKLASWKVEETMVTLTPDSNIYLKHNNKNYAFPKIGDELNDKLLLVAREKTVKSVANTNITSLNKILKTDYKIYSNGGKVVDISIYANQEHINKLKNSNKTYAHEILDLYNLEKSYWKKINVVLSEIVKLDEKEHSLPDNQKEVFYTDELAYLFTKSREWLNPNALWVDDNGTTNNIKIKYVILQKHECVEGAKLVGRYGDKGILSTITEDKPNEEEGLLTVQKILPEHENLYYVDHNGNKHEIEMFRNQLGVMNRQNLSQFYEHTTNFIVNNLCDRCSQIKEVSERSDYFFKVLIKINSKYGKLMFENYKKLTAEEREEFWKEVYEHKVRVMCGPFEDYITFEDLTDLEKTNPELFEEYEVLGVERKQTVGENYTIRLKHDSSNKSSVRSTGMNTSINLPASYKMKKKHKEMLMSDSAIRNGVMELLNIAIINNPRVLKKFYQLFSINSEARAMLVDTILENTQAFDTFINVNGIKEKDINKEVLEKYFELLEIKFLGSNESEGNEDDIR